MAEAEQKKNIIIKKIKKISAGAHGGSWKVAYADLVTAMMAFFLLMWLLSNAPQEKKEEIANYFNEFSLFNNPGPSATLLDVGGVGPPAAVVGSGEERPDVAIDRGGKEPTGGQGQNAGDMAGGKHEAPKTKAEADALAKAQAKAEAAAAAQAQALEQQIEQALEKAVPELAGQVSVTQDKDKVRVEIMDKAERPLYDLGGVALLPDAQRILAAVTDVIRKEGVKVAIEGHTDAYRYSGAYSNWDLSAGRALAARRFMVGAGLNPDAVAEVTGYSDTRPYVPGKPYDPKNRRISLLLYRTPREGERGAGGSGSGAPAKPAPPRTPDVGEVLEKQINTIYDKSTEGQF
ncbi:MAG: flagellar motor protein [Solidesulfovibrio magneticus str. Maddingley MBC34]|uniref:Flagellar motor protein n=1 Tax=Solidesulfovibrio magneticus str. Maddingley MBC34 TaxID=1206767 RepID=K6GST4_9BACT|nr:MAG: flagellar motor protein [Solidesulfovibrio magneticus str. Maddingley MBC34]